MGSNLSPFLAQEHRHSTALRVMSDENDIDEERLPNDEVDMSELGDIFARFNPKIDSTISETAGKPITCKAMVARSAKHALVEETITVDPPKAGEVRVTPRANMVHIALRGKGAPRSPRAASSVFACGPPNIVIATVKSPDREIAAALSVS